MRRQRASFCAPIASELLETMQRPYPIQRSGLPFVKVCCIRTLDDALAAFEMGAAAIGLVSAMPTDTGEILDEAAIGAIARAVPRDLETFLLTSRTTAEAIAEQHRLCETTTIQLCDRVAPDVYARLRSELPAVRLVQVVHVWDERAVAEALASAPYVDALLLDSGSPDAAAGRSLGGTGRMHDWALSRRICAEAPVPVYLAGGLRPENVAAAMAAVRPSGLDVCSGVRSGGFLDRDKLARFMAAIRAAAVSA
jgi:phosphoribosylanthranilate isomerase